MVRRQWDSTVHDLSVHRPTRHELEARKIALQSPNLAPNLPNLAAMPSSFPHVDEASAGAVPSRRADRSVSFVPVTVDADDGARRATR